MAELTVPSINFAPLGELGNIYKQGQADALRQQTLQGLGRGGQVDPTALIRSGDLSLAQLGLNLQQRQQEAARQASQDAESARRWGEEMKLRRAQFAENQDYTPEELDQRRTAQLKAAGVDLNTPEARTFRLSGEWSSGQPKPKTLSISDISKLSEEGGKLSSVAGFADTFKPEYAGYKVKQVGEFANTLGRNLPESVVGENVAKGAQWWQNYDRYKNVIRNDLYGSALTKQEIAAFEAADITPGMDPKMVSANLARQRTILQEAVKRKAAAAVTSGYDPKAVAQAYGIDPGGTASPTAGPPPPPQPGQLVDGYRYKGGNPADPNSWVKAQ